MKHNLKVTLLLLGMFLVAQLIGIYVAQAYLPNVLEISDTATGASTTVEAYDLPYGFNPPQDLTPNTSVISILMGIGFALAIMFLLMRFKAALILRLWFFVVVCLGLALAFNAFLGSFTNSAILAFIIALPLAYLKIFKRSMIVHNLTELFIYPGIAAVFAPLLTVWSVVALLIVISIYDIYAVWHAGFMQKMAKYQIEQLRVFSGFFIPYISKKDRMRLKKAPKKKVKINVAILGGGDVVFPIILSSVVLKSLGLIPALIIAIGATIALGVLLYFSEKGKFYPAMPFISAGCFIALLLAYLVS